MGLESQEYNLSLGVQDQPDQHNRTLLERKQKNRVVWETSWVADSGHGYQAIASKSTLLIIKKYQKSSDTILGTAQSP